MPIRQGILVLALAAIAHGAFAQGYIGGALGVGGADVEIGSFASGYRGGTRLFGGYAFDRHFAVEGLLLNLDEPDNKPANASSTVSGIGVAAVGTVQTGHWRFSGRLGLMSMEGKAHGSIGGGPVQSSSQESWQGLLGIAAGYDLTPNLTLGLETNATSVKFGAPVNDKVNVSFTGVVLEYRFQPKGTDH
jgi:outer membrane protein with beta-barrel domain